MKNRDDKEKVYRIGELYRDKGSISNPEDQFQRWFKVPNKKTIPISGGIRQLRVQNGKKKDSTNYACIVIVSNTTKSLTGIDNPWTDFIDFNNGVILYWGDAKKHATKKYDDWAGNKIIKHIWGDICSNKRELVPPILFFEKPKQGYVKFCGLTVIEGLSIEWFSDQNVPVPNYRIRLGILKSQDIKLDWILDRVKGITGTESPKTPESWKKWVQTETVSRLDPYGEPIKKPNDQIPTDKDDRAILEELRQAFEPKEFETAIVEILKKIRQIKKITVTRPIKDGGFDFIGDYWLKSLRHEMRFKGEVKMRKVTEKKSGCIGPKDLARLAARLGRGEFGIFVTTSYYTDTAQRELYIDKYPIKLISGVDLIYLMKEFKLIEGNTIKREWIEKVKETAKNEDFSFFPENF